MLSLLHVKKRQESLTYFQVKLVLKVLQVHNGSNVSADESGRFPNIPARTHTTLLELVVWRNEFAAPPYGPHVLDSHTTLM